VQEIARNCDLQTAVAIVRKQASCRFRAGSCRGLAAILALLNLYASSSNQKRATL